MKYQSIQPYSQKEHDLGDVYSFLADKLGKTSDQFDLNDFDFQLKKGSYLDLPNVDELKKNYSDSYSLERIQKIVDNLSRSYPVYLYKGEIIVGVHRSIAYSIKQATNIPIIIISEIT